MTLKSAIIEFSGQFGGEDAAEMVLPHFKALQSASKSITVDDFPYPILGFILRVDGEVSQYGFSGAGEPDVDRHGEYLSIDIGVQIEDRSDAVSAIRSGILNSPEIIRSALSSQGIYSFDVNKLRAPLEQLCDKYEELMRSHPK